VVLVVRDGVRWLRDCLRALSAQTYPRIGVIAVDNGSTDGSVDLLLKALGPQRVLQRDDNPSLPAAVQTALSVEAAHEADYVLIHHDDVALDPEAITRMVEVAERIDGVGVVGPKIVDWDNPSVLREVGLSTDRFGYPYSPLEPDEIDQGQYDRVREVLFVSSAAMLVSRAALDRAGPPDERFRSFHDDLDFCWRARLAGFRVVMTPLARARHRGASRRGERPALRGRDRARYYAERASLGALLKNYGLLSLLWILPLYALQGMAKVILWAVERRFSDVTQVLAAWGWNLLRLPGTVRRRVRAQSVRSVPDRSVRRYMAPSTVRFRRWMELAPGAVLGRKGGIEPDALEAMDELEEPPPLRRRAVSMARAHPVATAWVLLVVVAILAYRHVYGGGTLQGGALAAPASSPTAYFRELLSGVRTTALGGAQAGSPALGFLGVLSFVFGASTAVAQKVLLFLLPPAAGYGFYRALARETGQRGPSVVGAACYGLSAVSLWGFSEGRIPVLVMMATLPLVAGRIAAAFRSPEIHGGRFVVATAMVLSAGVAFFPGMALGAGLLLAAWLVVPGSSERLRRGALVLGGAAAVGAALLLPMTIELVRGGGGGLASTVGRPAFTSLLRLAPGGGPGSWSVGWFLPIAAILAFTLVEGTGRPAIRYLVAAVGGVFLAWASAAGDLPRALSNPAAYLAIAALAYSALVAYGLGSALPRMGGYAFGYRQLAVVVVVGLLIGGLGLQAALTARGDWAIGTGRLAPAWSLVSSDSPSRAFRVLWLGRESGEPFPPPGGDPLSTLRVGGVSLRYGLTDRNGVSMLDYGRDQRGPGYRYLQSVLGEIVSGDSDHAGALLAPLGVRYVVSAAGDLPRIVRRRLGGQVDLDLVPTLGLTVYQNQRALPEASFTSQPVYAQHALGGVIAAGAVPPAVGPTLGSRGTGFAGRAPSAGAVLLAGQYDGGWRLDAGGRSVGPNLIFGWAMRFPVPAAGPVRVEYTSQTARRVEIAIIAVLWLAALWITRKPSMMSERR
jgi:GT2 family glycosyltransferase